MILVNLQIKKRLLLITGIVLVLGGYFYLNLQKPSLSNLAPNNPKLVSPTPTINSIKLHPLAIAAQRQKEYPGSDLKVEQTLSSGSNFRRFVASYQSENLKINGLLLVPSGNKPEGGWPAIVFNHGYIPPQLYRTTEKYEDYQNSFAKAGFVIFKPDYRGHGSSEGEPTGAYFSEAYLTDVMNALASIKKYPEVNPNRIGMWGHSLGGHLTLRGMVVSKDIKAAVIWAGVVGSYDEMYNHWMRNSRWRPSEREEAVRRTTRQQLIDVYGEPNNDNPFWYAISPINFVEDISGPVQIHHGSADDTVPMRFSQSLATALKDKNKTVEFYQYPGGDHNLSGADFNQVMKRSIEFFDKNLK